MNQYSTDLYDTAVTRHYQVLFMDMVLASIECFNQNILIIDWQKELSTSKLHFVTSIPVGI